jgi:thiamine biosynthesis protein ThiS
MQVRVNGKPESVEGSPTVRELLVGHGLDPARVAVEINEQIVPRASFGERRLQDADTVEIVQFVGGG